MKRVCVFFLLALIFNQCSNDDDQTPVCSTPATVRDLTGLDGCGWVFELEDGTRLEPLRMLYCGTPPLPKEVTEDPLHNFEFVDGKKVFINYETVQTGVSICMVGPIVRITCISEVTFISEE